MELPIGLAAFAIGFALGLSRRVAERFFTWFARILAVVVAAVVVVTVVNLVSNGAGSLLPDAEACRVDSRGELLDPAACAGGQDVTAELYAPTVVVSSIAFVVGVSASLLLTTARAARRRRAAAPRG